MLKRPVKSFSPLLFWLLLSASGAAYATVSLSNAETPEFLPVHEAYQAALFSNNGELLVDWQIAENYYLYKHAFALEIDGENTAFTYGNSGIDRHDEYFGEVTVFYNNLQLISQLNGASRVSVSSQGCADAGLCYPPRTQQFYYDAAADQWFEGDATPASTNGLVNTEATSPLVQLLLLAFIGGLILNLMPCVLPVLTLKSLSFAKQSDRNIRIQQGWAYTAGVIVSFSMVAGVLIALKASGQAIGWGFQLQSPLIIAALVYIFFVMALSLLGAFNLAGPVISGSANANDSLFQSFSTGALACIVASPCTAPFMGTAIGSALTLSAIPALLVFVFLGAGMAAPFLILSYAPSTGRFLPKPGAWMNTLKELLAFPLLATCIWLISIASQQSGTNGVIALLSGCMLLALIVWWRKSVSLFTISVLIIIATATTHSFKPSQPVNQERFSITALDELIQREPAVFVNVTATWCITCKANEVIIAQDDVQQLFARTNTRYVEADWTGPNPDITALLARHQRNGIPLYLYYRNGNINQPLVLPQLLSATILQAAIKQ